MPVSVAESPCAGSRRTGRGQSGDSSRADRAGPAGAGGPGRHRRVSINESGRARRMHRLRCMQALGSYMELLWKSSNETLQLMANTPRKALSTVFLLVILAVSPSFERLGDEAKIDKVGSGDKSSEVENGEKSQGPPAGGYGNEILKRMVQIQGRWDDTSKATHDLNNHGKAFFMQAVGLGKKKTKKPETAQERKRRIHKEIQEAWDKLMALGGPKMKPSNPPMDAKAMNVTKDPEKTPALLRHEHDIKESFNNLVNWPEPIKTTRYPGDNDDEDEDEDGEDKEEHGGKGSSSGHVSEQEKSDDAGDSGVDLGASEAPYTNPEQGTRSLRTSHADVSETARANESGEDSKEVLREHLQKGAGLGAAGKKPAHEGEPTVYFTDDDAESGLEKMVPDAEVEKIRRQTERAMTPSAVYVTEDDALAPLRPVVLSTPPKGAPGAVGGTYTLKTPGMHASGDDDDRESGNASGGSNNVDAQPQPEASAELVDAAEAAYKEAVKNTPSPAPYRLNGPMGADTAQTKLEELAAQYSNLDLMEHTSHLEDQ